MYKFAHYNDDTLFFQNDQLSNSEPTVQILPNQHSESEPETDPEDMPMSSLLFRTDISKNKKKFFIIFDAFNSSNQAEIYYEIHFFVRLLFRKI